MASQFIASGRRLDHMIGRISLTCGLFLDNLDIWISVFRLLYLLWPFLFHIKLEWKPGIYNSRTFAFLLRKLLNNSRCSLCFFHWFSFLPYFSPIWYKFVFRRSIVFYICWVSQHQDQFFALVELYCELITVVDIWYWPNSLGAKKCQGYRVKGGWKLFSLHSCHY